MSDDGSKLLFDGRLVIDNDGAHGAYSKTGVILLDDPKHSIKVDYFQGPGFQIALQLFSNLKNSSEVIFPATISYFIRQKQICINFSELYYFPALF